MKESVKGVILSGLVYPGVGQLVAGSVLTGAGFVSVTTAGLLIILYRLTQRIYHAIDQLLALLNGETPNIATFIQLISRSTYKNWRVESFCLILVMCCWLVSILHAYLIGRKRDRKIS